MHARVNPRTGSTHIRLTAHVVTGVWVQMVMDFRYLSRALPTEDTFKLTYEDWLDETGRPEILDNLVDFIGACSHLPRRRTVALARLSPKEHLVNKPPRLSILAQGSTMTTAERSDAAA